jgi:hypothetical protein
MSFRGTLAMKIGGYPIHLRKMQLRQLRQIQHNRRLEDSCVDAVRSELRGRVIEADVVTIVPTHRRPELLLTAVASALAQNVDRHHVVVVDDGAGLPDDVGQDPRVTAISLPINTKIAGLVRNVGLRVSESRFVAFLDDDNTWTDDHLERSLALHSGEPMLTYTGIRRVFSDGRVFDVVNEPWDRQVLKRRNFVDMSAIVVRRFPGMRLSRLLRKAGDVPAEDWQFVWKVSAKYPVAHVDAVTVNYAVDQPGMYSSWREEFRRDPP